MESISTPFIYKFAVDALVNDERAHALDAIISALPGVVRFDANVEKRVIRIISADSLDIPVLKKELAEHKFHLQEVERQAVPAKAESCALDVSIDGMTCHSCELTIERHWKKLPGVKKVAVNAARRTPQFIF